MAILTGQTIQVRRLPVRWTMNIQAAADPMAVANPARAARLLLHRSITAGSIPRSSLRCDSDVGWVESFGVAQDRLRDTHHPPTVGIGAPRLHPPYNHAQILFAPIRYPAACCGVFHSLGVHLTRWLGISVQGPSPTWSSRHFSRLPR